MAAFGELWSGWRNGGGPAPYLLLDGAGFEGGAAALPRQACAELECLFTGELAQDLADVAPYLGRLPGFDGDAPAVVEDLLKRHVGMLVLPRANGAVPSFADVHRHFRKFNVVYDPQGKPLFFRYYDPRVIVEVLSVLEPAQLEAFFGPVDSLVLADSEARLLQCRPQGGRLAIQG